MTRPWREIVVHADAARLAGAAADELAARLRERVEATGAFLLVLAGGGTPRALHAELATRHADLPWRHVHVFFGDERRVPPSHAGSNFKMAAETLLSRVAIRPEAVHRMPGEEPDADRGARDYEDELRRTCAALDRAGPDLAFLGMGADGHTASLFPGSPALEETERWVVPAQAPPGITPGGRLTLTYPALAATDRVLFLVAGESKRKALEAALDSSDPPPAGRVKARGGVQWFVDEAAAGPRRTATSG